MNSKIAVLFQDNLPMPLIHLAAPEDWAAWYISQLEWSLTQGEVSLAISVFSAGVGTDGIRTVLLAVQDFLNTHPQISRLQILCGDEAMFCACRACWETLQSESSPRLSCCYYL